MIVVPYLRYDGMPTMRDSEIISCYELMQRDVTADIVFYDGSIDTAHGFLAFVKSDGRHFYVVCEDDRSMKLGCGWLDTVRHRTANTHFTLFAEAFGKRSVEVGSYFVSKVFEISGLMMLIGYTPSFNKRAIDFAVRCGASVVGEMPHGSVLRTGESVPTTILYYAR